MRYLFQLLKFVMIFMFSPLIGTLYKIVDDGSCEMAILRDTDFQTYDYGMTSRMKEPKEALNLDGDFYEMGKVR